MNKKYLEYEDYYDLLETTDQICGYHFPDGKKTLERAKNLSGYEIIINRNFSSIDELERKIHEDLQVSTVSFVIKYYKFIKEYQDDEQKIFYIEFGPVEFADMK